MLTFHSWLGERNLVREMQFVWQRLFREVNLLLESDIDPLAIAKKTVWPAIKESVAKLLAAGKFTTPELQQEAQAIISGAKTVNLGEMMATWAQKGLKGRGIESGWEGDVLSNTVSELYMKVFMPVLMGDSWEAKYPGKSIEQIITTGAKMRTSHGIDAMGAVIDQAKRTKGDAAKPSARQFSQMTDDGSYEAGVSKEDNPEDTTEADSIKATMQKYLDEGIRLISGQIPDETLKCMVADKDCARKQTFPVKRWLLMSLTKLIINDLHLVTRDKSIIEPLQNIYANHPDWRKYLTKKLGPTGGSHRAEILQFIRLLMRAATGEPEPASVKKSERHWFKKLVFGEEEE